MIGIYLSQRELTFVYQNQWRRLIHSAGCYIESY